MKIKLAPYTAIDGVVTFPDSAIRSLYAQMVEEKTADTVFYDGAVRSGEDFLNMMKFGNFKLYVIFVDQAKSGILWLHDFGPRCAQLSFCLFKNVWGGKKSVEIGKKCVNDILYMRDASDNYIFDMLYGCTPKSNRLALRFVRNIGWKHSGDLPCFAWDSDSQSSMPVSVNYITRNGYGR